MIKDNFYPTATTTDGIEFTAYFNSLPEITDISTDPCSAYYMGSIQANLLTSIMPHKFEIEEDTQEPLNTKIKFEIDGSISKADWGYAEGETSYIYWNGAKYLQNGNVRLINSMESYKYTKWGSITLNLTLYTYFDQILASGETIQISDTNATANLILTYQQFIAFIKDDTPISATFTISGVSETHQLKFSELTDNKVWKIGTDRFIVCTNISDSTAGYYGNTNTKRINPLWHVDTGSTEFGHYYRVSATVFPQPDLRIQFTTELDKFKYYGAVFGINNAQSSTFAPNTDTDAIIYHNGFTITGEFLDYIRRNGYTHKHYIFNCNFFRYTGSGTVTIDGVSRTMYQTGLSPAHNLRDFWTMFCLHNKCKNTGYDTTTVYDTSHTIAMFTASNQPVPDRAAFTTYPTIEPDLQNWQKYGYKIEDDDYDPGAEPGGGDRPDPEGVPDAENSGDDIYRPDDLSVGSTLGFVTQYTMTAAQITQLGQILWASFFEADFWQNLLFSLTTTGTINVSEILEYFISLRVYPFSLVNIPGHTNMGQDMYIGTGFIPMHFSSDLFAINSYAAYIDAGKVKLPFYFGDFRDCQNMEITMYLPYCGTVQLEPADVLGGTIAVEYAVDFATGACTAYADIDTWDGEHYQIAAINGQIGADVPLSGGSAAAIAARLGSDILNVAGILTAGAGGVAQGAMIAASGQVGAGIGIAAASTLEVGLKGAEQAAQMATRPGIGAPALAGGRGFASFGSAQTCYIQVRLPKYDKPDNYDSTAANPAAKEVQISSCRGLCRFINPNVAAITAHEEEKRQIRAALQAGIII